MLAGEGFSERHTQALDFSGAFASGCNERTGDLVSAAVLEKSAGFEIGAIHVNTLALIGNVDGHDAGVGLETAVAGGGKGVSEASLGNAI